MVLYNSISSSLPANTNVIMGVVGDKSYFIDLTVESDDNKKIVSDFIMVTGKHACVNIENFTINEIFEANIVIPEETDSDISILDYDLLSNVDKVIVTNFVNYIISNI